MRGQEFSGSRPPSLRASRQLSAAEARVHLLTEVPPVVERVTSAMGRHGYSPKDIFAVRVALEEAIVNAIKHGHRGGQQPVRIDFRVGAERVLASVADQGRGFDPGAVRDPLAPENLEVPSGRGLLLMRSLMTWVRFNARGNCVTLCRRRGRTAAAA